MHRLEVLSSHLHPVAAAGSHRDTAAAVAAAGADVPACVDAVRYPLHDAALRKGVLDAAHAAIARDGYCELPGFVRAEAVSRLLAEVCALEPRGFRSGQRHNVFLQEEAPPDAPPLHRHDSPSSKVLIAQDLIHPASALRELYEWDALPRFLAEVFGMKVLHRPRDVIGGVYYNVFDAEHRDALGWHFDNTPFSINLILQETSPHGGEFQYVPDTRAAVAGMSTWAEVESHIDGKVRTPPLRPGSLYLFAGRRSLHRVTPVLRGRRVNAILPYTERPDDRLTPYTLRKFYGREA